MAAPDRAAVLCVDDQPEVLEGLSLHLRRRYKVLTATSGAAALDILKDQAGMAVVMSDMRMPGMDGATLLAKSRQIAPDATRILLTGQASLETAIMAVNGGGLFRFLVKPCPPAALLAAIEAGVEQHRLITSERVLLEETLHGSIGALIDVLALANPLAFGRANRIKQHVAALSTQLGTPSRWEVEVAAMLSQIGYIILQPATLEKVYFGKDLTEEETAIVERAPAVAEQLLGNIPRLDVVRGILKHYPKPYGEAMSGTRDAEAIARGARILRVAVDFDVLEGKGFEGAVALDTMRGRPGAYDPAVLDAFLNITRTTPQQEIRELPFASLQAGMILAEDVKLVTGTLLIGRGYEVTEGFVARARGFARGTVHEPVRVILKAESRS